jgi:cytochrome c553
MRNKILVGALVTAFGGLAWAGVFSATAHAQDGGKDIKVLKGMSKADIKKNMKVIATSLGVQCDHCHDTDDMAKDTPKKEKAREMMLMSDAINKQYFKGEKKVGCVTCHNGKAEPKK